MSIVPRVSAVNPKPGNPRQGSGGSRHQSKPGSPDVDAADLPAPRASAPEVGLDPLLAELDRLRTMDPTLTESGAHRALKAVRAYTQPTSAMTTITDLATPAPPDATTGSEPDAP